MCSLKNIRLAINVVVVIKVLVGFGVVVAGGYFSASIIIQQAYGSFYLGTGIFTLFSGLASMGSAAPLYYAIKRHNRAVIIANFFFDLALFVILISIGYSFYKPTIRTFDLAMENDCLRTYPRTHTEEQCQAYFRSDQYAGFRLVWSNFFSNQGKYYNTILSVQSGGCCGFGPPLRCMNDTRPFPSDRPITGVAPQFSSHRLVCGHHYSNNPSMDWYRAQSTCTEYYNLAVIPAIVGGCSYDLGLGSCLNQGIDAYTQGCAAALEDYMTSITYGGALYLMAAASINFLCMFLCMMMFLKRKYDDVFPEYDAEFRVRNKIYQYEILMICVILISSTCVNRKLLQK